MRSFHISVILSMMCFLASSLQAQLISVKSEVDRDSMMIGDQVVYKIRVEAAENVEFQLPILRDTLSSDLEVLFPIASDSTMKEGKRVVEHSYMITGFESGLQLIPSQPVVFRVGEQTDTALSMPLMMQVFEPEVDTAQQIKPIKPPLNTPLTFREALPWIGVGLGSAVVVASLIFLIRYYRRRSKDPALLSLKPQDPAHVIAFRELDKLKEEKFWEHGEVKLYYTRLTEITRQYIERQYGIPAMERTTEEILHAFRKSNLEENLLDEMLKELLLLADLVKFAKEDPLPVDNQTHLNNAYIFVQKTYPLFYKEHLQETKPETEPEKSSLQEPVEVMETGEQKGGKVNDE